MTLLIARFAPGFWSRMAVLLGLVFGTLLATVLGLVNWGRVGQGAIVGFPTPFAFGTPQFSIGVIVSMTIVILVIMAETTADILAVGEILGTRTDKKRIAAGLRADMGATAVSPVFNGFPISRLRPERRHGGHHRHPVAVRGRGGRRHPRAARPAPGARAA